MCNDHFFWTEKMRWCAMIIFLDWLTIDLMDHLAFAHAGLIGSDGLSCSHCLERCTWQTWFTQGLSKGFLLLEIFLEIASYWFYALETCSDFDKVSKGRVWVNGGPTLSSCDATARVSAHSTVPNGCPQGLALKSFRIPKPSIAIAKDWYRCVFFWGFHSAGSKLRLPTKNPS